MAKKMFEQRPIPAEVLSQLTDCNSDFFGRIELAEKCREEYGWRKADILALCNNTEAQYQQANILKRLNDKGNIQESGADILFSNLNFTLYRLNGRLILRSFYYKFSKPRSKYYILDDLPFVAAVTIELLRQAQCGQCKIDTFLRISTPSGEPRGDLRHHILAMRTGYPVDVICHIKIHEGTKELVDGMHDWRISNMRCAALSDIIAGMYEDRAVYSDGDTLYVKYDDQIFLFDKSPELPLIFAVHHYHCESRDKRMVLRLGNQKTVSLSRFVMASHLYCQSMPIDSDEIYRLLQRLRTEHPGAEVDHLNATVQDCRLQNLMLVSAAQNKRKEGLQKRMIPLRTQYFADAVRYDDDHVCYTAGRFGSDGVRIVESDKILSFDGYLKTLESFVTEAEKSAGIVPEKAATNTRRGRKLIDIPNFEKVYARYERSGLSKAGIAQKMKISIPTLNRLLRQYKEPENDCSE